MNDKDVQPKKRKRRGEFLLERDIMEAVKLLVEEKGFTEITQGDVMQRAGIVPAVFYKRYRDLGELFELFTRKYDYFFTDIMDVKEIDANPEKCFREIMANLIPSLYKNRGMQRLLVWELNEDNATTRRTAHLRETCTEEVTQKLEETFEGMPVNFRSAAAVLIGGIYYMILHSRRSTFCGINFNSRKGQKLLAEAVDFYVSALLDTLSPDAQAQSIARKMKAQGIDAKTIEECTGVKIAEN